MSDSGLATDSWIFLSVARSDGADLSRFFSAAEHIHCAAPTDDEIEGGINRLASCGLILIERDCFKLSAKGIELFNQAGGLAAYPRMQPGHLAPLLEKAMLGFEPAHAWTLDPGLSCAAFRAHAKRMGVARESLK